MSVIQISIFKEKLSFVDKKAINERSGRKPRTNEVTQISMTEQTNSKAQRVHSLLLAFVGSKA